MAMNRVHYIGPKKKVKKLKFPNGVPLHKPTGRLRSAKVMRDYDIFKLSVKGHSPEEISGMLQEKYPELEGVTPTNVASIIRRTLENVRVNSLQTIEEHRAFVTAQIDEHIVKMNQIAARGKAMTKIRATETLIKLWERRSKILGLDQISQKVEIKHEQVVRIYEGRPEAEDEEAIDVSIVDPGVRIIDGNPPIKEIESAEKVN